MSRLSIASALVLLVAVASTAFPQDDKTGRSRQQKVYELRTYHVLPGRMPAMLKRFREHTTKLFEKHGMENIGYWTPEGKEAETKLIYLLAHDSPAAAKKSWDGFRNDANWQKVRDESEEDGKIVDKVESVFLRATDFSKLK